MPIGYQSRTVQVREDVKGNDLRSAFLRVRATGEHKKSDLINILNDAVDVVYGSMKANVPRSGPGEKNPKQSPQTIAGSIDREKIPRYSPGGAGGGGFYDARVGFADPPAHLEFVLEGTGIHGPEASPIQAAPGNLMTFFSNTHGWSQAAETEGQEPQREWYDNAWLEGKETLALGVQRVMSDRR